MAKKRNAPLDRLADPRLDVLRELQALDKKGEGKVEGDGEFRLEKGSVYDF